MTAPQHPHATQESPDARQIPTLCDLFLAALQTARHEERTKYRCEHSDGSQEAYRTATNYHVRAVSKFSTRLAQVAPLEARTSGVDL